jgi:hypothetical protein
MTNLNVDRKSNADFAVKSAHDRFHLELDYSDQSIAKLENIITQIYWGFTSRDKDVKDGLIYNTALIWGSYLGEFMRNKWGGTWVLKGSDPTISIKNIEFAPIALILHKISDHPEYSLESFLIEAGKRIPSRVITPLPTPPPPVNLRQPKILISSKKLKQPRKIDKRLLPLLAGIGLFLLAFITVFFGYRVIKAGGLSAFGLNTSDSNSRLVVLIATTTDTATPYETNTPLQTPTLLPTYTPRPTLTLLPSTTPLPTDTPMATFTPIPTDTPTRTPLPTKPTRTPTNTHVPATEAPAATKTPIPGPTNTQPPPPRLNSCEISPSSVPAGEPTALTFIAHFNYPGIQFNLEFTGYASLPQGCTGTSNSDGTAECLGSSGLQPGGTRVDVKFTSSAGDCTSSFSTP